jgi:hypothetical protein
MFKDLFLSCVCSDFGYINGIVNPERSSISFMNGKSTLSKENFRF